MDAFNPQTKKPDFPSPESWARAVVDPNTPTATRRRLKPAPTAWTKRIPPTLWLPAEVGIVKVAARYCFNPCVVFPAAAMSWRSISSLSPAVAPAADVARIDSDQTMPK
jgi:hypothetical protein